MHLVVTIPAYNEEKTISSVITSIPKKIQGIKKISVVVCDDGSTDSTVKNAKKTRAIIISHKTKQGLARTFSDLIHKALEIHADIIVNTDADNQYDQKEIPKLITPILTGDADFVNGNRQVERLPHMKKSKQILNIFGSWGIRFVTGTKIQDASSGFRAMNSFCARQFFLLSEHTYTHETIIQAANTGMRIAEVPITFRKREHGTSRLIANIFTHLNKSILTIIRAILMYKAFYVLGTTGVLIFFLGILGGIRFLYFLSIGQGNGHIQSLILSSVLINLGMLISTLGIIADLISINRKQIEHIRKQL